MRIVPFYLLSVALFLAACGSATVAQSATTEPSASQATTVNSPTPANTPLPTLEDSSATVTDAITSAVTNTEANTTTNITATPLAAGSASPPVAIAQTPSQMQAYENLASPVDLLASYYNAVNRQEYERAYGYWQAPPNDYDTFAAGYADTAGVQLIVQPPTRIEGAAGSLYVEIPTVLIAQHNDGSTHTFAGCIVTRKSNLHPPDIPEEDVWHLYQALISEVPNNSAIPTLLAQGCQS
ncbi:MAG: hypothetical protein IT328_21415 [Caldilineaceae bacterium]|nr:hypothetical protein [Caldilineaceae bacterium]